MNRPNRSHPSLTPLTTLPPSPSYLHPTTSIPPTPSLLSRPSSQTRLRPARSAPVPTSTSSPALLHHNPPKNKHRRPPTRRDNHDAEDDWVTRTASSLALARLEEKGQGWLAKRGSSTSFVGGEEEGGGDDGGGGGVSLAGRGKVKGVERKRSWMRSRRGSFGGGVGDPAGEEVRAEEVGPDFVDGVDEEGEGEGEDVDEGEMRRVVMGRVGGWVDWAVGWMDFRGEGDEDGGGEERESVGRGEDGGVGGLDAVELQRRLRKRQMKDDDDDDDDVGSGSESTSIMSAAPEKGGVWSDAKWLLGVASKVAL